MSLVRAQWLCAPGLNFHPPMRSCPCSNVSEKYESSHWLPFGRRPSREEGLISVITNGNILYLVTFKWLLTGAYGLPHTFNALTQYISYFNCLVYNVFLLFFSSQNFRRGGALAPCIDAPPLCINMCNIIPLCNPTVCLSLLSYL